MTEEELNQKLLDIENNAIALEAEQKKQAALANVGAQYGKSGFYRNLNPSENIAATESSPESVSPPGGFKPQRKKLCQHTEKHKSQQA